MFLWGYIKMIKLIVSQCCIVLDVGQKKIQKEYAESYLLSLCLKSAPPRKERSQKNKCFSTSEH